MPITPLCTDQALIKREDGRYYAKAIRCKRWSCQVCSQLNRRRVISIAVKAKPRALLTLTVSSKQYPDPDLAADALKRGLRLLRLRLQRHEKLKNFRFLAVFEKHKSGFPHLHLLIKGEYIPWQMLRKWWEEITGSTHIDIRRIKSTGAAAYYVAKYIGKDLAAFAHCKRWWRSKGFSAPPESREEKDPYAPQWHRYQADVYKLRFAARLAGWLAGEVDREMLILTPPPNGRAGITDLIRYQWVAGATHRANARSLEAGI